MVLGTSAGTALAGNTPLFSGSYNSLSDKPSLSDIEGVISTAKLADNAVTSAKIQDGTIATADIADAAITSAKLDDNAVNSAKIIDGSIVNADVNASAAIAGSKIAPDFGSQNIKTTGNVSIGTDQNWDAPLSIASDNPNIKLYDTGTGGTIWRIDNGTSGNGKLTFRDGNTPKMTIANNGEVQLDSTGDYALHTTGDSFVANTITSYRDESGDHAMFLGRAARGSNASPTALQSGDRMLTISARGHNGSDFTGERAGIAFKAAENWTGTAQGTYIDFFATTNGETGSSSKMTITNDGKVGIGTTSPAKKLEVNGDIQVSSTGDYALHTIGDSFVANTITSYRDESGDHAMLLGRAARGSNANPTALQSGDRMLTISARGYDGSDFKTGSSIAFETSEDWTAEKQGSIIDFITTTNGSNNSAVRMRINKDGKVGIGTDNPAYALDIADTSTGTAVLAYKQGDNDKWGFSSNLLGTQWINLTNNKTLLEISAVNGSTTVRANLNVKNGSDSAGQLNMYEDSDEGVNKVTLQAPALSQDVTLTLPNNDGDANQVLLTDGNGVLSWVNASTAIGSGDITNAKLADNAVTSAKILDGTIVNADIADAAITSIKIADGSVETIKLAADAVTSAKIQDGTIATADVANAAITSAKLAANAVTSAKIQDGTIATADIADAAITSIKIADGSVETIKLAADAVTSAKIQDGTIATADVANAAITSAKLAANAVTSAKIQDGTIATADVADAAITSAKLADNAVTSAKILNGTIATADVADAAITSAKLADNAVTSAKIQDGTIATADVADAAITSAKLADNAVTSAKILNGTIATDDVADAAITSAKLAADAVTSAKIQDGTIATADVANAAITNAKLATDAVTSAKILNGTIATADVADAAITNAKLATDAVTSAKILNGTIATDDVDNAAITNAKLDTDAVTSSKIQDGTIATADVADAAITNAKLATDAVTSAKILNGTIATDDVDDGSITFPKLANELVVKSNETTTASDTNIFTGFNMMKRLPFGARIHIENVGTNTGAATIDQKVETIWKISTATRAINANNTMVNITITNTAGHILNLNNYTVSLTYEAKDYDTTSGGATLVDNLRPPVVYDKTSNNFYIKISQENGAENQDAYLNIMIFPGEN
jgi:hypothetical protein